MPLLDHFHPPLSRTHPWRGFHGAWAAAMARLLNAGVLPPGYYAVPFLDRDGPVEIDVATLRLEASHTAACGDLRIRQASYPPARRPTARGRGPGPPLRLRVSSQVTLGGSVRSA